MKNSAIVNHISVLFCIILLSSCGINVNEQESTDAAVKNIIDTYASSEEMKQASVKLSEFYKEILEKPEQDNSKYKIPNAVVCMESMNRKESREIIPRLESEFFKGEKGLEAFIKFHSSLSFNFLNLPSAETACSEIMGTPLNDLLSVSTTTQSQCPNSSPEDYSGTWKASRTYPAYRPNNSDAELVSWFAKNGIDPDLPGCRSKCSNAPTHFGNWLNSFVCTNYCTRGVSLFYANGMFNTFSEAIQNANALSQSVCSATTDKKILDSYVHRNNSNGIVTLSLNFNEEWWRQVLQVVKQKLIDDYQSEIAHTSVVGVFYGLVPAPDWLKEIIKDRINQLNVEQAKSDEDLETHYSGYKHELELGNSVIVISHSQGNFYTNFAARRLKQDYEAFDPENKFEQHFGSIPVASPAVSLPAGALLHGEKYISLRSDWLIPLVTQLNSLPGNVSNSHVGIFDHNFINGYLNGDKSHNFLMNGIAELADKLRHPPYELKQ